MDGQHTRHGAPNSPSAKVPIQSARLEDIETDPAVGSSGRGRLLLPRTLHLQVIAANAHQCPTLLTIYDDTAAFRTVEGLLSRHTLPLWTGVLQQALDRLGDSDSGRSCDGVSIAIGHATGTKSPPSASKSKRPPPPSVRILHTDELVGTVNTQVDAAPLALRVELRRPL
jgi:hypothetical protein